MFNYSPLNDGTFPAMGIGIFEFAEMIKCRPGSSERCRPAFKFFSCKLMIFQAAYKSKATEFPKENRGLILENIYFKYFRPLVKNV